MRPLSTIQTYVYNAGGLLLILGALLPMFLDDIRISAPIYALGALMFCSMQALQGYSGTDITIRRLRKLQLVGCACLFLTAVPLVLAAAGVDVPFIQPEYAMMLFSVGAVFEVYTAFRLPAEIERKSKTPNA